MLGADTVNNLVAFVPPVWLNLPQTLILSMRSQEIYKTYL